MAPSATLAATGSSDEDVPQCVYLALTVADVLEDAALAPFPDLDIEMSFETPEDSRGGLNRVRARIAETALWAARVGDICGPVVPPIQRPDSYGKKPQWLLIRTEDIYDRIGGETLRTLFHSSPDVAPRTWYARDVLGDPPSSLHRRCAADILIQMQPTGANDPFNPLLEDAELLQDRIALTRWRGEIRNEVADAHRTIRAHALTLVAWIREQADRLTSATLPAIQLPQDDARARSFNVHVTLAGRSRSRQIKGTHLELLTKLSRDGQAVAIRKDVRGTHRAALEARIPELRGLIETVPGTSDANSATFRVSEAMRSRISPAPRRSGP